MLANFYIWAIIFLLRAVVNMLVRKVSPRGPMCFKCLVLRLSDPSEMLFLVVFSFFEKTTYCCRARRLSVRPSVEIISFRGISKSNRPIDLKMSMNVRKGVVHVRNA